MKDKKEVSKPKKAEKKQKYIGEEILIVAPTGAQYKGKCTSYRKTNDGGQVYLQLNGVVSRWFSTQDISK